jgi:hypothetical protein
MPGLLQGIFEDVTDALSHRASERIARELPMLPVGVTPGGLARRVAVASSAVRPRGDMLLERWDDVIHRLGVRWHKDQLRFLLAVRNNAIPGFYGASWAMHRERVCRAQRVSGNPRPVMFTSPRRWGKTTSMAGAAACYALTVPRSTQAIFSTGRRASQLALRQIYRMVCARPEWAAAVTTFNQEKLVLRFAPDDERTVYSYPSNVRVRERARRTHTRTHAPERWRTRYAAHAAA